MNKCSKHRRRNPACANPATPPDFWNLQSLTATQYTEGADPNDRNFAPPTPESAQPRPPTNRLANIDKRRKAKAKAEKAEAAAARAEAEAVAEVEVEVDVREISTTTVYRFITCFIT